MQIRPLGTYREPCYPTDTILDEHPELLRLVPKRWRGNPVVLAALTGVCLLASSYRSLVAGNTDRATRARVAPVFQHGDGRSSFGCRVINPPVFLSEDEARQVIEQEARKADITFRPGIQTLPNTRVPATDPWWCPGRKKPGVRVQPLKLDGTDQARRISYEYVSHSDFLLWQAKGLRGATAYGADTLDTAKRLRDGLLRSKPAGSYAVFYDPLAGRKLVRYGPYRSSEEEKAGRARQRKVEEEARTVARRELRSQVRDFVKWLKAQGVI